MRTLILLSLVSLILLLGFPALSWAITLTSIGTATSPSGTLSITVGVGGVPAGNLIVCGAVETLGTPNPTAAGTVADSASNTYTKAKEQVFNTSDAGAVFYVKNNLSLAQNNTITYTPNSTGGPSTAFSCFYATGIDTVAPLDTAVTASNTANSAVPTVTSGVPASTGELIVGNVGFEAASTTFTQDSTHCNGGTFQNFPVAIVSSVNIAGDGGGSCVQTGAAAAVTYAPTITAAPWLAIIVGFKAAGGGAVQLEPLTLIGVGP